MSIVDVNLPERGYQIHIEEGLLNKLGEFIKELYKGQRISIITDANVAQHYKEQVETTLKASGFHPQTFVVESGEVSKSIHTYHRLLETLAETGHSRTDWIIALGGGVIGDLTGFIAASYLRGVPFVQVPTSLLAQIDSSVGGKTGINLVAGKNLVGAIYQPKAVYIDPSTLETLPQKYLRDGIGEAIKYGYIDRSELIDLLKEADEDAFGHVLKNREKLIKICCESKRDFVIEDERDFGKRMILNFGHTIGHAIEKVTKYEKYTHGEAVAMGMYYMMKISCCKQWTDHKLLKELEELLKAYDLLNHQMLEHPDRWIDAIGRDKKNLHGKLNIIYVKDKGTPVIHETTLKAFHEIMKEVLV